MIDCGDGQSKGNRLRVRAVSVSSGLMVLLLAAENSSICIKEPLLVTMVPSLGGVVACLTVNIIASRGLGRDLVGSDPVHPLQHRAQLVVSLAVRDVRQVLQSVLLLYRASLKT